MSNPPKQKGTAGETELLHILQPWLPRLVRNPASCVVDLTSPATSEGSFEVIQALATRPDRGRWLISVEADVFGWMASQTFPEEAVDIEVKRYARFAHHKIFEEKFPRSR